MAGPTITTGVALVVLAIIVFICVLIACFMAPTKFQGSKLSVFFVALASMSIFIIFLFYYALIDLNTKQQNLAVIQETSRLEGGISSTVLTLMTQTVDTSPEFVFSLNPLLKCKDTPAACINNLLLSYQVFVNWQSYVNDTFIPYDPLSYVTTFLQRANSPQLYKEWQFNRINFKTNTQQLGELLFEYALPITDQRPEVYVKTAQKMIQDQRFTSLFIQ